MNEGHQSGLQLNMGSVLRYGEVEVGSWCSQYSQYLSFGKGASFNLCIEKSVSSMTGDLMQNLLNGSGALLKTTLSLGY